MGVVEAVAFVGVVVVEAIMEVVEAIMEVAAAIPEEAVEDLIQVEVAEATVEVEAVPGHLRKVQVHQALGEADSKYILSTYF